MIATKEDCVELANKLIIVCKLQIPRVAADTEIRSILFIALYNAVSGEELQDINKYPQNSEEEISNIDKVISSFSNYLLRVPIPHIRARALVSGETESLYNLLQLFESYLAYLLQDISSQDDDAHVVDSDDDECSSSLMDKNKKTVSSSLLHSSNLDSSNLITYNTNELIALGATQYLKLPPPKPQVSNSVNKLLSETPTHQLIKESEEIAKLLGISYSETGDVENTFQCLSNVSETWDDRSSQDVSPLPEIAELNGKYLTVQGKLENITDWSAQSANANISKSVFSEGSCLEDSNLSFMSIRPKKVNNEPILESKDHLQLLNLENKSAFQRLQILQEKLAERTVLEQKIQTEEIHSDKQIYWNKTSRDKTNDKSNGTNFGCDKNLDYIKKRLNLLRLTSPVLNKQASKLDGEQAVVDGYPDPSRVSSLCKVSLDNPKCKKWLLAEIVKKDRQKEIHLQEMKHQRSMMLKLQALERDGRIRRAKIRRFYNDHKFCQ